MAMEMLRLQIPTLIYFAVILVPICLSGVQIIAMLV